MERMPLRDLLYSTRILQIKGIYNYELVRHMYKMHTKIFPNLIRNGFNIFATAKLGETIKTSKLTYKVPLVKTHNENDTHLLGAPQ